MIIYHFRSKQIYLNIKYYHCFVRLYIQKYTIIYLSSLWCITCEPNSMFFCLNVISFFLDNGNLFSVSSSYFCCYVQLVTVIKTCSPNGCGDIMVTLKVIALYSQKSMVQCTSLSFPLILQDKTGCIAGTVNRRVMVETEFGRLVEPGAVMLLHQVGFCIAISFENARLIKLTLAISDIKYSRIS